jgi:predicted nucleic acid-binding protein
MSGANNILVDTNLIILGVGGSREVRELLEGRTLFISVITEIELLSIPFQNAADERLMRDFISNCFLIELDSEVRKQAVLIRKKHKTKLPDAVIAASSMVKRLTLFTADKGFSRITGLNAVLI